MGSQRMKKEGLTTLKKILPIDLSTSADRTPLKGRRKAATEREKRRMATAMQAGTTDAPPSDPTEASP